MRWVEWVLCGMGGGGGGRSGVGENSCFWGKLGFLVVWEGKGGGEWRLVVIRRFFHAFARGGRIYVRTRRFFVSLLILYILLQQW